MAAKGRRLPTRIPHHPFALTVGLVIALIAFIVMTVISWMVITGASSVFASVADQADQAVPVAEVATP